MFVLLPLLFYFSPLTYSFSFACSLNVDHSHRYSMTVQLRGINWPPSLNIETQWEPLHGFNYCLWYVYGSQMSVNSLDFSPMSSRCILDTECQNFIHLLLAPLHILNYSSLQQKASSTSCSGWRPEIASISITHYNWLATKPHHMDFQNATSSRNSMPCSPLLTDLA